MLLTHCCNILLFQRCMGEKRCDAIRELGPLLGKSYIDASTANLLTLIKYVDFRAALKRVCDDFVGRDHYMRNYTSALIIP